MEPTAGPRNPYLADSLYAIAHGRCEAVDWTTGESAFHFVLGGSQFNTLGGGVTLDEDGRLLFGTIFGKTCVLR